MFTYQDVVEFLKELKLPVNADNVKWGYATLLKELKIEVKMRSFEAKYHEPIFECCCEYGEECCCGDNCCCGDECCTTSKSKNSKSKAKKSSKKK